MNFSSFSSTYGRKYREKNSLKKSNLNVRNENKKKIKKGEEGGGKIKQVWIWI